MRFDDRKPAGGRLDSARIAALCVALLLPAVAALAQRPPVRADSASPPPSGAAAVQVESGAGEPVVLGVDTLFRLYGSLGPFSAAARASAASERLRVLSSSGLAAADSVVVIDRESYSEIAARDVVLLTVLDADARPLGRARADVARTYAARIDAAIHAASAKLGAKAILTGTLEAAAATAALLVVLWLLGWIMRRTESRIHALRDVRIPALRIQDFEILSAGRLATLLARAARVLRIALILLAFYIYVPLVLSVFPWTAPFSRRVVGYAVTPFVVAATAFGSYLPNLFYLAAGIVITRYVLAFTHLLFEAVRSGSITIHGFYRDWAEPTYKIVRVLVFAFAVTLLYPFLPGASSDAFKGVSLFLGILFSLGSSAAIGNIVAGVVLTYTRAFQVGDRVKIGDTVGDVIEKTLLVTRLRTIKNVAVTVPNGAVLSSHVVNYTTLAAAGGLILHTTVTIGYDAPWLRVHELLIAAAGQTPNVLSDPAPFVLQTGLEDFYVSYELNAYTDRPDLMAATYSRLHENIQNAFNAGGVEIMSPHYASLRDGNETTVPRQHRAADYRSPEFRIGVESTREP